MSLIVQPRSPLQRADLVHAVCFCVRRFSAAGVHAQTAAMRPELFHVECPEAVTFEEARFRPTWVKSEKCS